MDTNTMRDFADYQAMFSLDKQALQSSLLIFPAGISPFGAKLHQINERSVVSFDPYYDLSPMDMVKHVDFVMQNLAEQASANHCAGDINAWQAAAQIFLSDYSVGQKEGRYLPAHFTHLNFGEQQFDLALCPDIFLADTKVFATNVILELARVAKEVRIFPLQDERGVLVPELAEVMFALQSMNLGVEIKEVTQLSSEKPSAMLRVWSKGCIVA